MRRELKIPHIAVRCLKCDETLSWVFDISSQWKPKLQEVVKNLYMLTKIRYSNTVTVMISALLKPVELLMSLRTLWKFSKEATVKG